MKVNIDPDMYLAIKRIIAKELGGKATKSDVEREINRMLVYRVRGYPRFI